MPILVFGALSVSDLDGLFDFAPDADDLDARRGARGAGGGGAARGRRIGYHLKIDTGMNRLGFRHDNLRRTLPELLASAEPASSMRSTRTSRPPTIPESPLFDEQRARFERGAG